jgi:uncharacterized protein (DUF1015 family)
MAALRAQTGVVFLTYRASPEIDRLQQTIVAGEPLYDFTAPDGVQHTVWRAGLDQTRAAVDAFASIPALYIADGHHRAASAARTRAELAAAAGGKADAADAGTFVAVAFPDSQVQILPYHRTVKDLAGATGQEFLAALKTKVPVSDGSPTPAAAGLVSMYLGSRWYTLDLTGIAGDGSRAASLDVARLHTAVLEPVLRIGDVRTDKRIDFIGGARGTAGLQQAVDTGKAAVAFSMHPVTVEDLIAIADAGDIMPPKSTWFEPKLRDGLLIHEI